MNIYMKYLRTLILSNVLSYIMGSENFFVNGSSEFEETTDENDRDTSPSNADENEQKFEKKHNVKNEEVATRYKIIDYAKKHSKNGEDEKHFSNFQSYAARRIFGGMKTSISMYPYNVAIAIGGVHWCGGSIIDEQWILSAGHCFESVYGASKGRLHMYTIRAGSSFHNHGGYQARVNKVFFTENYSPSVTDYDYALVRLDRPMPIGNNIAVVDLPSSDYPVIEGDLLIVTGWGSTVSTGSGQIPDRLRYVPVPVMAQEECRKLYKFRITKNMLCAGYFSGGKDACNHDSGGPAVRDGVLLGIVSFGGEKCGDPRSPGVYSRVTEITDWVEHTISNNEANTVKELIPNIQKARQRQKELQSLESYVDDEKEKIKNWLHETLNSPTFNESAKKKFKQAGLYNGRRNAKDIVVNASDDDKTMDDINLANQIHDRIIEEGAVNDYEKLLRTLALAEALLKHNKSSDASAAFKITNGDTEDDVTSFLSYIVGETTKRSDSFSLI